MKQQRHIVHILYRFAAGGLENVLIQLINGLPHDEYRHSVIALSEIDAGFAARIQRDDVELIAMHKAPGQPFVLYPAMYRLLRRLKPDVVHSCNIAALEFMPVAALAGVPLRIHAEHGWDVADPDGRNPRYRLLRRVYKHSVHVFIAVSTQLHTYLHTAIAIPAARLHLIANGVDCERFRPLEMDEPLPAGWPFQAGHDYVIGTVGRLEPIKNQRLLVEAFIQLAAMPGGERLGLAIVGDGPLRSEIAARMAAAGLQDRLWLPGSRADVAEILRRLDCFVLPSLAEGTSCTLQEAMASGVCVMATDVGGNRALLQNGDLGQLVPSDNVSALCTALAAVSLDEHTAPRGHAAREHVSRAYSLSAMLHRYAKIFQGR